MTLPPALDVACGARYISIFSGIESVSCAWEPLGFQALAFSEIDKYASAVLATHYPHIPNLGDITKIDWSSYHGKADIVVGGSPCQSFSIAGKREGLHGASGLMYEYIRAVQEVRPRWLLWENVPGAFSSSHGEDFRCLLGALDELGYGLAWRVLDSRFFGVPQRRRRVYLVGHLGDRRAAEVLFECESLCGDTETMCKSWQDATGTNDTSAQIADTYILQVRQGCKGGGKGALVSEDISPTLGTSSAYTLFCRASHAANAESCEDIAPTLTAHAAKDAPLILFNPPRHLTPLECERLQGFPDGWTAVKDSGGKPLSNTQRYKMLGNAMTVPVMRWIGERIKAQEPEPLEQAALPAGDYIDNQILALAT